MKTNELQLVSFEQAKKLNEVSFDWYTQHHYYTTGEKSLCDGCKQECFANANYPSDCDRLSSKRLQIKAPTVALALKWFRDVKHQYRDIRHFYSDVNNRLILYFENGLSPQNAYKTYEEAEFTLLNELLKINHETRI